MSSHASTTAPQLHISMRLLGLLPFLALGELPPLGQSADRFTTKDGFGLLQTDVAVGRSLLRDALSGKKSSLEGFLSSMAARKAQDAQLQRQPLVNASNNASAAAANSSEQLQVSNATAGNASNTSNASSANVSAAPAAAPENATTTTAEMPAPPWCGYQAKTGFFTTYTKPASDNLLFDLTEAFGETDKIRFVVTAMVVTGTYSDSSGYVSEYAYPMEETADTMFEFRLHSDNITVDVFKPQLAMRTSDDQMVTALERGTGNGRFQSLPTFRCAKRQAAPSFIFRPNTPYGATFLQQRDLFEDALLEDKLDEANSTSADVALAAAMAAAEAASAPPASPSEPRRTIINAGPLVRAGFYVANSVKAATSYRLLGVKAFERNVDVTVEYIVGGEPMTLGFSLVKLPDTPMKGREADDRLLFFTTSYRDLGEHSRQSDELPAESVDRKVETIWRYNLASLPGEQIRIHIDPTVPKRWRPWFRKGVEAWNQAFGLFGKPTAVRAVLPEDDDWPKDYDVSDARFSTISWTVSAQVVSMGIAKVDPRSGEILKSDIVMSDGWVQAWLGDLDLLAPNFSHSLEFAGGVSYEGRWDMTLALNARRPKSALRLQGEGEFGKKISLLSMAAGKSMQADELEQVVGQGLQNVVTHETGHILGLRHNFKGSLGVTYACIRSPSCSAVHGLTASVMDYLPVNLPSADEPDVHLFSPILGGYDKLAIKFGYMEANKTENGTDETLASQLQDVLREAEQYETCYDADRQNNQDPSCMAYDISADPLQAYEDEITRLAHVQTHLLNTSVMPGAPYTHYGEAVETILQLALSVGVKLVGWLGGVQNSYVNRHLDGTHADKAARKPLPRHVQKRALSLLLQILRPGSLGLLPPRDALPYLVSAQSGGGNVEAVDVGKKVRILARHLILSALEPAQIARLYAQERLESGQDASAFLSTGEFLAMFVKGVVGSGLASSSTAEWDLQRQLVKGLNAIHDSALLPSEVRAHAAHHLLRLRSEVEESLASLELSENRREEEDTVAQQELMQAHLTSLMQQITSSICSNNDGGLAGPCPGLGSGASVVGISSTLMVALPALLLRLF